MIDDTPVWKLERSDTSRKPYSILYRSSNATICSKEFRFLAFERFNRHFEKMGVRELEVTPKHIIRAGNVIVGRQNDEGVLFKFNKSPSATLSVIWGWTINA